MDRIDSGLAAGLEPGVDAEASPACMVYCSAQAIAFGDLDDEDGQVAQLVRTSKTAQSQEVLGTEPSLYYVVA
jgi:phenylacetyl-CoA:acceptor oxidoreductase subunit 1